MKGERVKYYDLPKSYWCRIHFVRPRFKSHIEHVLLYMASECCRIPECSCAEYNKRYLNAIRMFPGNIGMAEKTLQNWRTEIPALFGFYVEDKVKGVTKTSKMATFLNENQDLTQFFRFFLLSFQFPGGHLKPKDIHELIANGIRLKPAKFIIQVLLEGNRILHERNVTKEMSISAEEATYCIFNDKRVAGGKISPAEVAQCIISNRVNRIKYYNPYDEKICSSKGVCRSKGDVVRYAGDILDYMVLADLLEEQYGYFRLKGNEQKVIQMFVDDDSWFDGYDRFYGTECQNSDLSDIESKWFEYVNSSLREDKFKTDFRENLSLSDDVNVVFGDRITDIVEGNRTSKDIGNLGEAIVCSHEKMRLKIVGYDNQFIKLVQVVDSPAYHPGFDIDSFEGDGTEDHRYIEVKTTISKKKIDMYGFHMTPNEWRVANTIKDHYCVYRLMISSDSKTLYVLRNPVALYKEDKIEALPTDGMEVSFDKKNFNPTELLVWKK